MLRQFKSGIFRYFRREAGATARQVGRSPAISARRAIAPLKIIAAPCAAGPREQKECRFRAFKRESDGLAAVEFALILPVLMAMLFGMGELSLAIFARTSITQIASTVADLVAQEQAPGSADISNVYNAANIILYPYPSRATIRITSVIFDTTTNSTTIGKVAWSCTQAGSGTLATLPTKVTFKQPLLAPGGSVLMVEVAYNYASPTTQVLAGSYPFQDQFYTKPRRVGQIPAPACPAATPIPA